LPNGRSLSVRQICTKSIHRPSRRAQAPTAPQRERRSGLQSLDKIMFLTIG
jgi:hypothetical protein